MTALAEIVFEHTVPTSTIIAAVVIAVLLLAYSSWRYLKRDVPSLFLVAIRLAFWALLVWCLFLPMRRNVETKSLKPKFVVALDTSESMLMTPSPSFSNRWEIAVAAMRAPWPMPLSRLCDIEFYTFSDDLGRRISIDKTGELVADGKTTALHDVVVKVADRYKGQNVAGVLLLSDGLDTREKSDDWVVGSWPWPIYTLRLENHQGWEIEPEVRIESVHTPRRVNAGWNSELKAVVSGQGTKGAAINVQLFKDETMLDERPIQIAAEGGTRELAFNLDHPAIGVFSYTVRIPPLPKQRNTNQNAYAVSVQVVDAKNRLLYVEGPPRWESKFMVRALRANKNISPLCFISGSGGKFMSFGQVGNMTPDMTEAQLAAFKIIILGDLSASELKEERALNILRFVEPGGNLVLLGGTKAWGSGGFSATSLRKLMPIKEFSANPEEGKFALKLTDDGRSHPAFPGKGLSWEGLPPVLAIFPGAEPTPGAVTLLTADTESGPKNIVVAQRYGQGKVIAVFTDSLWRWSLNADPDEPYQRFWNQMLDWLTPSEEESEVEKMELSSDREQLFLNEEVELSARLGNAAKDQKGSAVVSCEITMPDKRKVPFDMVPREIRSASGRIHPGFVLKVAGQLPGKHIAVAKAKIDGKEMVSEPVSFEVKPFTPEKIPRMARIDLLRTISRNSSGRCFDSVDDLSNALSSLKVKNTEEEKVEYSHLWNTMLIICLLIGILSIEWFARRWRNMP